MTPTCQVAPGTALATICGNRMLREEADERREAGTTTPPASLEALRKAVWGKKDSMVGAGPSGSSFRLVYVAFHLEDGLASQRYADLANYMVANLLSNDESTISSPLSLSVSRVSIAQCSRGYVCARRAGASRHVWPVVPVAPRPRSP